jgi:hypothetical protein
VHDAIARLPVAAWPVALLILLIVFRPLFRILRGKRADAIAGKRTWSPFHEAVFAIVVAGALMAHMMFGGWGWFARYEAYALAFGAAAVIVLWREPLHDFVAGRRPVFMVIAVCAILCLGSSYVTATAMTPIAAREIYEQQYQMRRLAVSFYRRPVGVNDLGWVSYRNPSYVLDLVGLGSEAARKARASGEAGAAWIERLVRAHDVGLVMIYDDDFAGQIPSDWQRLAVLHTSHHVVNGYDRVAFYATSPAAVTDATAALCAFRPTLVAGSSLTMENAEQCAQSGQRVP